MSKQPTQQRPGKRPSYSDCLRELEVLEGRGMHRGLDRMQEACRLLGNPERSFKSIHIAGTNGKGSTCAMVTEIFKQASFKTGLTISPHIESLRERIQVDGRWITQEEFVAIHEFLKQKLSSITLTYFEWILLMAFVHFSREGVEWAVVETGMGGRWDASNVLLPEAGAITNVSLDHEAILGSTREAILAEKMEIAKPGMIFWTGLEDELLLRQLSDHCRRQNISLRILKDVFKDGDDSFSVFNYENLRCGLAGKHQHRNAALATAIVHSLRDKGWIIEESAIRKGLKEVQWPGRLELISEHPRILVDGAHNQAGIEALARHLTQNKGKYRLLFGALRDRPFEEMIQVLKPYAFKTSLALFKNARAYSREELKDKAQVLGLTEKDIITIQPEEWSQFYNGIGPDETLLVAGSLYLVSQVRSLIKDSHE